MDKSRRRFLDLSSASIISAALPASSEARQQQSSMDTGNFLHGVASGDPLSDQVIIWTRVSAQAEPKFIRTRFELALDKAFLNPVQTGYV
ncbi:MAG: PhoD-like phosphatase N-terminal domain-containing protein, partial [Gammaproteobacteria bacterium]|nr:PhoD-like phosphatase N-terminal domain-containing protein [Gammaproteobacteria bacterium]